MTLVKSKKFKVLMGALIAIALFGIVNYNVWDYAKANESNDGEQYEADYFDGDHIDTSGHNHKECICWVDSDWVKTIKIDKDCCVKLDKGGIKGSDLKNDYVGSDWVQGGSGSLKYRIMDISLEVHDNNLRMNYETDTPWQDFDGAEWTLDFGNGFTYRWQDRMDGKDHESHKFNKDELKKYFNIDSETTTLQQAIENGQCSLILHSIYIDDIMGESWI